MKRHKSVAAILLIMVMIITMMSAMVFAANVKYWGDEFATVTDEDGSTFMTVRTFGSDGLIKAQAIGEPGHEAPTDETGEVATRYFYKLDGSALVYGDDNKALDGSTWTQDAFKTLESQVRVRLVAPPYVKDYNAQSPAAAVLAPDDFIGWKVELEVSDYDDTQTYVDQRITVSIKLTPDVEINGTAAAPVMYGSAASAAITVKGEGNDPTTAKVYLDAANEDNYATFSGGALTGLYDGETHTVVADTFPGYTVSYEVWDAAPGRYIPVDSVSITDVKEILFRVVYTDKKTSAQIQTQGISLNLTPAKGAYIGFKLLDPEDGWVYSVEGSDYSITDYIAVEPMNNKPYSTDAQVGELEQLADAACAKAVSKNEAEIISYFNELYEVVESVSEDTPNLVDLAIVPRDLTVNEKTAIAKKYEVLTRNISQVKPGEGIAYSEVDNTARIILNGMTDHTLTHQDAVEATCTSEGNQEYWKCSVCGRYFKDADAAEVYNENEWKIGKKDHTLAHQEAVAATCTAEGNLEYWKCSVCKQYFKDAAATETYDENEWKIVKAAHTLTHQAAAEATCTAEGNQEYWKCSVCEQYFKDAAATEAYDENEWKNVKTAHTLAHQEAVAATCTSEGNQEYWKCSECGQYFKDAAATEAYGENEWKIVKAAHTLAHQEAVAATCTAEGNLEYWKCSVCKQYFKDAAATETYDENEWKIVKAAHTLTHQAAAEATCTAEGNQEYWKCSVCEQYFKDAAATEAYDENEWKNVKTAHTLAHQEAVAATCTSEGNQEYWKCSECGQYFKDAAATETYSENAWVVGKKDHDWNTVWTNNETKHWHKCKNCDVIKDEAVHSGGTATCKEKAKCEICEAEYGSFADHNMTHHPKVAAGANTIGNKEYWECSVCHKHFKDAVGTQEYADNEWIIPATGGGETPAPGGGGDTPSGGGGTDSEDTEVDAVQQVADQINALNEPYDAAKVKAAREAYDKLTDEQKKDSKLTDEMIKKLSDAEAAVESTQAVGKVSDMIRAIPDDFAKATSDQVSAAVEAYHSLTAEQKKLIDASDLEKLQSALNYPAQVQKVLLQSVSMKRGKQVVVKWKKNSAVNGYQLYLKAKGTKAKKISINKETKVKESVKKLKAGKSYNIKVRTYVEVEDLATGNPVKVYGQWSKVKKAKAKR